MTDRPDKVLSYRSYYEEPARPSGWDIAACAWWGVVGVVLLGIAGMSFFQCFTPDIAIMGLLSLIAPIAMGLFCLAIALALFRHARECLRRGRLSQRFTHRSSLAMESAAVEALARCVPLAGEHLLLGILNSGPNTALAALREFGCDPQALRAKLDAIQPRRRQPVLERGCIPPWSEHFRQLLAAAIEHSRQEGLLYVGTEHLLLALLAEPGGLAARMLTEIGVSAGGVALQAQQLRQRQPEEILEQDRR